MHRFRYVGCQLLALKRARIRNELDKCLRSLPRDLDETYERMLCSIDEEYVEEARLILSLLCVSDRPLTVKELAGALAIDPSKSGLDREGRSFSQDDPIEICLGLIETAASEDMRGRPITIARIAHFSVREYLESDRIHQQGAAKFAIQNEQANTEMARICLVYLLDPTLSNGELDEAKLEVFAFAQFAAYYWFCFYNKSGKGKRDVEGLVLRLFKDQKESFLTWVRLRDVASEWYLRVNLTLAMEDIPSPLYYAVLLGFENILSGLIASLGEETKINAAVNKQAGYLGNALQVASSGFTTDGLQDQYYEKGVHERMVKTLLYHGANVNTQGGYFGTALQAASYDGHEKVAQILLDHGAEINAQAGKFGNALQAAAQGGHGNLVQTLLDQGAYINAQGGLYGNALQAAAHGGHDNLAQTLLDQGADVNSQGGGYGNALQAAAEGGYENLVQILLDRGADVNAQGGEYGNALQAAAWGGHGNLVQTLLDQGVDINARGGLYGSALQAATWRGHEKVVQILLDQGADVNAPGSETYGTALQAAAWPGHENLVHTLLSHGADVNAPGGENGTALQAASSTGQVNLVQTLLDRGADVNDPGAEIYGTALQAASSGGHGNIVQILLDHGADVNAPGGGIDGTALQSASRRRHEKVVQILLDNGAEPESEAII